MLSALADRTGISSSRTLIATGYRTHSQTALSFCGGLFDALAQTLPKHYRTETRAIQPAKKEVLPMSIISKFSTTLTVTAVAACAMPMMQADSWAADCPAGKTAVDAMKPGPMTPSDVTDTVIASIDLAPIGSGLQGRKLRLRKLVVQPGGIVPWHSHDKRPANIYIISGSITEYRSTCAVPIEHGAGDVTSEFGQLAHWWKNNTKQPTVLLSADVLSPEMKADESM